MKKKTWRRMSAFELIRLTDGQLNDHEVKVREAVYGAIDWLALAMESTDPDERRRLTSNALDILERSQER